MADDTTRIINLTEATEVSDGMYLVTDASTGTRKLSLQKVLDKAGGNVADDYDATATYNVGDLCVYKGVLYECSTEISTAEAWNPDHWSRINLGDIVADIDGSIEELYEDKANESGEYDDIVAGTAKQLLSSIYTADDSPYLYRPTTADSDRERVKRLEGLSVGWNQLVDAPSLSADTRGGLTFTPNSNGEVSVTGTTDGTGSIYYPVTGNIDFKDHVWLLCGAPSGGGTGQTFRLYVDSTAFVDAGNGAIAKFNTEVIKKLYINVGKDYGQTNLKFKPQLIDLTTLFGSTIADHIYTLEQATAGSGVAWVKQYIDLDSYHEYSAPTIKSVEGLEAHVMRDADDNIIGNYPLDSTITLRGIPKLVDGKLVADGDWYEPSGKQTVRYGVVDLGTLNFNYITNDGDPYFQTNEVDKLSGSLNLVCALYPTHTATGTGTLPNKCIGASANSKFIYIRDSAYTSDTDFKTAVTGVKLVYELATPTSSTASPYTEVQICESGGTEEFVTNSPVPVGNVTEYTADLRKQVENIYGIPPVPEEDGEYTLHATVAEGVKTFTWESES